MAQTDDTARRATKMLQILTKDRNEHLLKIDRYHRGEHDKPYTPPQADDEFKQLAERCITNVSPLPVDAAGQAMAVDGYRPGSWSAEGGEKPSIDGLALVRTPQWDFWQRNRLDARQAMTHNAALKFGHSFVCVYLDERKRARTKMLSPLNTTALFADPVNDDEPLAVLHVLDWHSEKGIVGEVWDDTNLYDVTFDKGNKAVLSDPRPHGAGRCPVVRFVCSLDTEGRTVGLIEPLIPIQDRINQTVFDMLVAQAYGSFKVRTVTGMAPPMETEPVYERDHEGNIVRDDEGRPTVVGYREKINPETGQPIPARVGLSASKILFAEDSDTRFGQLDETPLEGYIAALNAALRHFSVASQTPAHYMLGEIANVSAEALNAAEHSLMRKIDDLQNLMGEGWEQVFDLAMVLEGKGEDEGEIHGEVIWRDLGAQAFAQIADGLGKFAEALEIPKRGLWHRVPGVTTGELARWEELHKEEQPEAALGAGFYEATGRAGSLELDEEPAPAEELVA